MKVRGDRECKDCGDRWSYYETGSIECPNCGSLRSVGVDERRLHTASAADLDLTAVRSLVGSQPLSTVAGEAADAAGEYVRQFGFIDAGELQPLRGTFLAAMELRYVGRELARASQVTDAEESHLLTLLDGAESGQRPAPEEVPSSVTQSRGLAVIDAIEEYRRDLRRYLDEHPDDTARTVLGHIEDHRTRFEALDGDVDPEDAEALLAATQAVGRYLIESDSPLDPAREQLAELGPET